MITSTLTFRPVSASLEYSSDVGRLMSNRLQLLDISSAFSLTSGMSIAECSFILHIHPSTECPYTKRIEKPWLGALRSMHSTDFNFLIWIQIPEAQFLSLESQCSSGNFPSSITVHLSNEEVEDGDEEPVEGTFDDKKSSGDWLKLTSYLISHSLPSVASDRTVGVLNHKHSQD